MKNIKWIIIGTLIVCLTFLAFASMTLFFAAYEGHCDVALGLDHNGTKIGFHSHKVECREPTVQKSKITKLG